MNKKLLLAIAILLPFLSCNSPYSNKNAVPMMAAYDMELAEHINDANTELSALTDRKIIKNGDISFETHNLEQTKSHIIKTVNELGGYISEDRVYDYTSTIEHSLTIRIPAQNFDLLLEKISTQIKRIDSKSIDILDVTEEYMDVETRLQTKREVQAKYRALLTKANTVQDILSIEREIGEIQYEIERAEGRMKYLDDRIALSTLNVRYYEKSSTPFQFGYQFTKGLKNGWKGFLWFIVGLAHMWVFILLASVLAYFIVFLVRRSKRKSHLNT